MRSLSPERIAAEIHMFATDPIRQDDGYVVGGLIGEAATLALLSYSPDELVYGSPNFSDCQEVSKDVYLQEVKEMRSNPYKRAVIAAAEQAQKTYADFLPSIGALFDRINDPADPVPQLGAGAHSIAYPLSVSGTSYALHTFRVSPRGQLGAFNMAELYGSDDHYLAQCAADKAITLALGVGLSGLSQLVAYSANEGICISELAPGKRLDELGPKDVAAITPEHIDAYVETLLGMKERGMRLDPNLGNVFWDEQRGFTIIDPMREGPEYGDVELGLELLVPVLIAEKDSYSRRMLVESSQKMSVTTEALARLLHRAQEEDSYVRGSVQEFNHTPDLTR